MRAPSLIFVAAIAIGVPTTAFAEETRGPITPAQRAAGCTVRPDHVPAGKRMLTPQIVECPTAWKIAATDNGQGPGKRDKVERD